MTATFAPAPANTSTEATLPLGALPPGQLLTLNEKDIPLIKNSLGAGSFHTVLDAALISFLTGSLAAEQNLGIINHLTGRTAGYTSPQAR